MATRPMKPVGVDLNDVSTLCLYNELMLFRADNSAELTFRLPDQAMQKTLHSIADALGLDYEYWKSLKQARISKSEPEPEVAEPIPTASPNPAITPLLDVFSNTLDLSSDPLLHDLMNPLDFSSWPYGDGLQTSDFAQSLEEDMPSLDNNEMWSIFDNDQPLFSPLPTPLSSSAAANEDFAAIFTDTSFFRSRRGSSKAGSKAGSGVGSRAVSRAGSAVSASSERGRKKVSKPVSRSSSANRSVGFQEIVFDSNPSRPASRVSGSSGRRRPLDAMARAAVKAVKALGACWRCKWLRKDCDEESPCSTCPKGSRRSLWRCVGCRRGNLESQVLEIPLCRPPLDEDSQRTTDPQAPMPSNYPPNLEDLRNVLLANACLQRAAIKRANETATRNGLIVEERYDYGSIESSRGHDSFLHHMRIRWAQLGCIQVDKISSANHPFPSVLLPLDYCILDILWEYFDNPAIQIALRTTDDTSPGILLILLRCAALYQAKLPPDSNRLITQSLICLRNSFEALRVNAVGCLTDNVHNTCEPRFCKVDCISNLTTSLSIFIDGLSKVFFKKENMRNKSWWLSIFYSFCIQSIVRQALIQLSCAPGMSVRAFSGARQYLYLPLRLFNATSGIYDPLSWDLSLQSSSSSKEASLLEDVQRAKFATDQDNWKAFGINSSAEYLNQLFDSDGETFLSRDSGGDNILTLRRQVCL